MAHNNNHNKNNFKKKIETKTASQAFRRLLPTQCVIVVSGFLPPLICMFLAGNLLGAGATAAVSYVNSLALIIVGFKGIANTSCSILLGKYLGAGDEKNAKSVYSVICLYALVIGATLTALFIALRGWLSTVLGMDPSIYNDFQMFLSGWALMCVPYIMMPAFLVFLQLHGQ